MKKHPKMDPKLVAMDELKYIATKYGASMKLVRALKKSIGRSRRKIYAELERLGYKKKKVK